MWAVAEHNVGAGINRRMCESFDIPSVFADKTFLTVGNMGLILSFGPSVKRNYHYVGLLSQFLDHPAQFCEIRYVKIVGSVAELSDAYLQSLALYYRRLAYALQAHGRQTCTAQSRHGRFAARMSEVVDVVVGDSHEVESGIDEIVHIFRRHAEYVVSLGIAHLAALARTIQKTAFEIATRNIDTPEDAVGVGKQIAAPRLAAGANRGLSRGKWYPS